MFRKKKQSCESAADVQDTCTNPDTGTYVFEVYNPCSGQTEPVEVSREVYLFLRRSAWREVKRTRRFFRHETQFTSLCTSDSVQVEHFHEFVSDDADPAVLLEHEARKELAECAFATLTPKMQKRFLLHYEDQLTCREIAVLENVSENAVKESLKAARKTLDNYLKNIEKS